LLAAIATLLERRGFAVVQARRGEEALEKLRTEKLDAAVVDIRMPGMSGLEIAREAKRIAPGVEIVLYTGDAERAHLTEALDVGARGFVLKEAPLEDLLRALDVTMAGGTYIDPVLAVTLAAEDGASTLSAREREILRLLSDGNSNEEIGRRLFISPETVRTHIRNAMDKLDADTRTQAVAIALRQHLIT
jgi:DNA-binding NarL/FixJ family response regulator